MVLTLEDDDLLDSFKSLTLTKSEPSLSTSVKNEPEIRNVLANGSSTKPDEAAFKKRKARLVLEALVRKGSENDAQNYLDYFDAEVVRIIEGVLDSYGKDRLLLAKACEELYGETRSSGRLDAFEYDAIIGETALVWPFDPDFESEEYYEHEERLACDESYASVWKQRYEQMGQQRRVPTRWPDFWLDILHKCPSGPTLFHSSARIPPYLFRVFDRNSAGENNEETISSEESKSCLRNGPEDILLCKVDAAEKVFGHMKWERDVDSNLVSWTSSLLFAIQYAFYRHRHNRLDQSQVFVCAVATDRFPRGQFSSDFELINAVRSKAHESQEHENFFNFRLNYDSYYNGEYFSQGRMDIRGRSSIVSLHDLIQAGLYDLYPEFHDSQNWGQLAKRVLELRRQWSDKTTLSNEAKSTASAIAQLFDEDIAQDIALMLLCFCNTTQFEKTKYVNYYPCNPIEVLRFLDARQHLRPKARPRTVFNRRPVI